jgi:hypothetical protein
MQLTMFPLNILSQLCSEPKTIWLAFEWRHLVRPASRPSKKDIQQWIELKIRWKSCWIDYVIVRGEERIEIPQNLIEYDFRTSLRNTSVRVICILNRMKSISQRKIIFSKKDFNALNDQWSQSSFCFCRYAFCRIAPGMTPDKQQESSEIMILVISGISDQASSLEPCRVRCPLFWIYYYVSLFTKNIQHCEKLVFQHCSRFTRWSMTQFYRLSRFDALNSTILAGFTVMANSLTLRQQHGKTFGRILLHYQIDWRAAVEFMANGQAGRRYDSRSDESRMRFGKKDINSLIWIHDIDPTYNECSSPMGKKIIGSIGLEIPHAFGIHYFPAPFLQSSEKLVWEM